MRFDVSALQPEEAVQAVGDSANDLERHPRAADIVWFNEVTRSTVFSAGKPLRVGTPWSIVGSRDFDRDGVADLLWYSSTVRRRSGSCAGTHHRASARGADGCGPQRSRIPC
jgi:hypothetical protein